MPIDPPIRESGHVVRTEGEVAIVEIHRSAACAGCAASGVCHTLGGSADRHELRARNTARAKPGDLVEVEIPARAALRAAAWVYLLPTALILAIAFASHALATHLGAGPRADLISAAAGLLGLVLLAVVTWWHSTRSAPSLDRLPVVAHCRPGDSSQGPRRD